MFEEKEGFLGYMLVRKSKDGSASSYVGLEDSARDVVDELQSTGKSYTVDVFALYDGGHTEPREVRYTGSEFVLVPLQHSPALEQVTALLEKETTDYRMLVAYALTVCYTALGRKFI